MKSYFSVTHLVVASAVMISGIAFAAGTASPQQASASDKDHETMGSGMMGQATMGKDMAGMMEMMPSCQSMMGNGQNIAQVGMPRLPPGNEKLEAQMHAEMMQKMGEIAARYVDRIKDTR